MTDTPKIIEKVVAPSVDPAAVAGPQAPSITKTDAVPDAPAALPDAAKK
jgi:hypothetical protein